MTDCMDLGRAAGATSPLAAIHCPAGISADGVIDRVVEVLGRSGVRLAGLVQRTEPSADGCCAVTRLRSLSDGAAVTISQDLGSGASGCRLDPGALSGAACVVEAALDGGVDLLILNRFGRSEAEGKGLRSVIHRALDAGTPVLLAVRDEHLDAWTAFHGGLGVLLPANPAAILEWSRGALSAAATSPGAPATCQCTHEQRRDAMAPAARVPTIAARPPSRTT